MSLSRSSDHVSAGRPGLLPADPVEQAFVVLRTAFTVAPVVFGLDKFTNLLTDWPTYLAPRLDRLVPGSAQQAMWVVGVVEVVAGLVVAVRPRWGAPLVAAWLAGIIVNLLLVPGFYDIALRDVGLLAAAVALWRLSVAVRPGSLAAGSAGRGRSAAPAVAPTGRDSGTVRP